MIPVGGAVLAFVGLAIPAFFFLALWRNRTRLGEPATRARYGFLYCGLRLVYWDTFDTLRKLAVAAVPVGTALLGDTRSARRKFDGKLALVWLMPPEIVAVRPTIGLENDRSACKRGVTSDHVAATVRPSPGRLAPTTT